MFLKNDKCLFYFFVIIIILLSNTGRSNTDNKNKILNYLSNLKYFSASFLQNDGEDLSEGKVYIGEKRVRAEYISPTKILIILDEDKAMYYNYELEEDEFFNPKNTNAWFFYDIFRNPIFFEDSKIKIKNNEVVLEKNGVNFEDKEFIIKAYFENNPLVLRGIEVIIDKDVIKLSIYNHAYNQEFDKSFFKLINPSFLN
tara:strand:- start:66 stop:662 length:597 start_codon:yes stop_codon:yes gene_type:complete